jgi:hypothetical protein
MLTMTVSARKAADHDVNFMIGAKAGAGAGGAATNLHARKH